MLGANLLAGEVYEAVVEADGLAGLDQPVLDAAVASRTPVTEELVTHFTDLGGTVGMPVIALVITLALAVTRRSWLPVVLMLVAAAGSVLITVLGYFAASDPSVRPLAYVVAGVVIAASVVAGVRAWRQDRAARPAPAE